ncbi:hypothetical protein BJ742DRAFT_670566 [Cladochytrium replicatum]|nr:hypothetical protein BJ742DRAFT_670566 [Cladochytrium replicatum]
MVRESNFNNPAAQQAAIIITPNQYDKRALTCADPLALTNSLVNLSYMTSISTLRIAYVLATDGGLELIVRILRRLRVAPDDSLSRFAYSAALTCLSNVAVRGNQRLRKRLVEAGVIPVIIDLLLKVVARWLRSSRESLMSVVEADVDTDSNWGESAVPTHIAHTTLHSNLRHAASSRSSSVDNSDACYHSQPCDMDVDSDFPSSPAVPSIDTIYPPPSPQMASDFVISFDSTGDSAPLYMQPLFHPGPPSEDNATSSHSGPSEFPTAAGSALRYSSDSDHLLTDILHRVDDILLAIKLVAYLSKYPAIRAELHSGHSHNVFELVEVFTATSNLVEVRRWAIICMRNAFKRDSASSSSSSSAGEHRHAGNPSAAAAGGQHGGTSLRRCGNLKCGKWEEVPRQYSKCSRCRRVTYCSKTCQRTSWPLHKNWCLKYESTNATTTSGVEGTVPPPPPAPADTISTLPIPPVTTPGAPRHTHTPEITTGGDGGIGAWGAPILPLAMERPIPPQPPQMDAMRDRVMMARRRENLMEQGQISFLDE